ncbi:uncharacterized protein PGTG_18014 [Puccinia graminis f. sp. tritici CRL 75-36-700-3]|uniref:Tr-type G domain-containing protein n=1 Tax=Puccinia graminis f. sp. tritici (strain CRL 75-36-700-3 / race SCCL) TaxID=418459 RepID=E3L715_PUCGT|nr:uncharacterized protein PGTG_18014 [Puccinia graminis f. sp. tritici CRL 75-36-700-3]EFP92340.2 hypothetical protein PGTG_18014 [Puccinia graminis f. sp. tritici CRL 75-36-700-3]
MELTLGGGMSFELAFARYGLFWGVNFAFNQSDRAKPPNNINHSKTDTRSTSPSADPERIKHVRRLDPTSNDDAPPRMDSSSNIDDTNLRTIRMEPLISDPLILHQNNPLSLRNYRTRRSIPLVVSLAHVDHGESSYADSLLAANNIITPKMAGKLRYLEFFGRKVIREAEKKGTIVPYASPRCRVFEGTSGSTVISLALVARALGYEAELEECRINLIDTPGHFDFTTDVSTASRLCDGALVLFDVVEGVCNQTISVLRQVSNEQVFEVLSTPLVDTPEVYIAPKVQATFESNSQFERILTDFSPAGVNIHEGFSPLTALTLISWQQGAFTFPVKSGSYGDK